MGWIKLSRPPFHSVGVFPFILRTVLAWKIVNTFCSDVFTLGILAVILIMLSTYQAVEYFDYKEDAISKSIFKSRFAGGTGITQAGTLSREIPLWTIIITIIIAAFLGLILQFGMKTGPHTVKLGAGGLFACLLLNETDTACTERNRGSGHRILLRSAPSCWGVKIEEITLKKIPITVSANSSRHSRNTSKRSSYRKRVLNTGLIYWKARDWVIIYLSDLRNRFFTVALPGVDLFISRPTEMSGHTRLSSSVQEM